MTVSTQRIAVIGSGISGLGSAWLLSQQHDVTVFEARDRLGGHTATKFVEGHDGQPQPVDTGFIVYNERNYPNLIRLFEHLGVETQPSVMSFSASIDDGRIEWAGTESISTLFAQRRNALRPSHYRMIADILRFNRGAKAALKQLSPPKITVGEFLDAGRYSAAFRARYLLPMAACIWSCPTGQVLDFPLVSFARFFRNHGLLDLKDRPKWRTVAGGSSSYLGKLTERLDDVRLNAPVRDVVRTPDGVEVQFDGGSEVFDGVVLATHSDQALKLLGDASGEERAVLEAIPYGDNRVLLHTDRALMPRRKQAWASWNYLSDVESVNQQAVSLTYWMNHLQPIPGSTDYFVTVNPTREPADGTVLGEYTYAHPVFSMAAVEAQRKLANIQGSDRVWFAGAWTGYGFHEDGFKSAVRVAGALGCPPPWS